MRTARDVPSMAWMAAEEKRRIADAVESHRGRLRSFIRRRVGDTDDAEDILQGLLVLARILFGGFRGGPIRHMRWRHRMRERWEQMTPEERERFREGLRGCGPARPESTSTT